jgi:myo-inositol-1-phosphate synthase
MRQEKIGVWLIGALGSISSAVVVGALALRKRLIPSTGLITYTDMFDGLDLVPVEALEFGGCDVRSGSLGDAVSHLFRETGGMDPNILHELQDEIRDIEQHIDQGTVRNCGEAIEDLAARSSEKYPTLRSVVQTIRRSLRRFKEQKSLDHMVVVNLASTEPPLELGEEHRDPAAFEEGLNDNAHQWVRASTLYAYAAIEEGCPFINFTPSNGALIPAMVQLAEAKGVPVMGNDGKTGETLVKSALAPLFVYRNLHVLSWEGFNLLGNRDGSILDHPANRESKIRTKDKVLSKILGYGPHSRVHIEYVPSLDDQKTAWDFIHFRGFLGAKMSLQFIWQGYDSLLAAPLVLDLVRLTDLARKRGEAGLMPQLASFFKDPLGVHEHGLHQQYELLMSYVDTAKKK